MLVTLRPFFKKMDKEKMMDNYTVDYYQYPSSKDEEIKLTIMRITINTFRGDSKQKRRHLKINGCVCLKPVVLCAKKKRKSEWTGLRQRHGIIIA